MSVMNEEILKAAKVVLDGGVILYPTETIAGLGCDARNEDAISKIFEIKKRPKSKSILSLFSSEAMILRHFKEIPDAAWDILDMATKPTTLILDNAVGLAPSAMAPDGSAAIRWVKSGLVHQLIEKVNVPLTSTSVNLSGEEAVLTTAQAPSLIKDQVDFILSEQQGESGTGIPSSIIRIKPGGEFKIIRK